MNREDTIVFEQEAVIFDRIQSEARTYLSQEQMKTLRASVRDACILNDLMYQLRYETAGHHKNSVVKHPTTWWDHFKERWFPSWAKTRWPVKYTYYDAYELFPNIPLPDKWRGKIAFFQRGF